MTREFLAVDIETANQSRGSICQIGIARYVDGKMTGGWSALVDPEEGFQAINTRIHGISSVEVRGEKTFPQIYPVLYRLLHGKVCISHSDFDVQAIEQACRKHSLKTPQPKWIDSAAAARSQAPAGYTGGFKLDTLCEFIGYKFKHHDAIEDAAACGQVFLAAESGLFSGLPSGGETKKSNPYPKAVTRDGNPEGPLFGKAIVFTGKISISKTEAADLAQSAGISVKSSVSKKVDYVVVGEQDLVATKGHAKSSKHRKAEELASTGHHIRIIDEYEFRELILATEE
ncbi:exonuclease domain-containing protein [uncultured Microbulbifer sp.]|uniref:exonuclease domain-containing protein n=1 Tax=uncultured Microbulbifer sp. TaxID=348147 RepID=UPI0025FF456D|nr:exonuclease domain-containing protein [uncultured Microbulbifer sp.]